MVLGGATSQFKFPKHLPDALPQGSSTAMKCHPVHAGSSQAPLFCGTILRINLYGSLKAPKGTELQSSRGTPSSTSPPFLGVPLSPSCYPHPLLHLHPGPGFRLCFQGSPIQDTRKNIPMTENPTWGVCTVEQGEALSGGAHFIGNQFIRGDLHFLLFFYDFSFDTVVLTPRNYIINTRIRRIPECSFSYFAGRY